MGKFKQNLIYAFIAQSTSMILSILISLILPKVLGVEEFAYWQLFIFYSGYVGILHFGLSDGLYLRYGGTDLKDMNKSLIGSQFRCMVIWQTLIAIVALVIIPFLIVNPERMFVCILTAIYLIVANATWCLGYIFQAANETRIYSTGTIISKVLFIFALILSLLTRHYDFRIYVTLYVGAQAIALIYSIINGWDFVTAKWISVQQILHNTLTNMKIGINLTLSNIASSLILGICRGFVDARWSISVFGIFSLAISLVNFILQFITQISMVMFPSLRQLPAEKRKDIYVLLRDSIGIIFCSIMIFYVPMRTVLSWWLPEYTESLRYLSIILPICVFDGKMQMLYNTYMKVYRKEKSLLRINLLSCVVSLILCILFATVNNDVIVVVAAMIIAIALRSVISSIYLSKVMGVGLEDNLVWEIALTVSFIVFNYSFRPWVAFFAYAMAVLMVLSVKREKIREILYIVRRPVMKR